MTNPTPGVSFYNQEWDKPYLTPSTANVLMNKTPYHAMLACPFYNKDRPPQTQAMIEGSVVDMMVLGGRLPIVTMRTKAWNTNAIKRSKRAAEKCGNIVLKQSDYDRCRDAANVITTNIPLEAKFYLQGTIKKRLFWEQDGVACSTEPDIHHNDIVLDLKRTRVAPTGRNWRRHASSMGYHIQAAACLEATGATGFGWVVVEADPPHLAVVHSATQAFIDVGKRDWNFAVQWWKQCVDHNTFPGYESEDIDPSPWLISDEGDEITFTEEV